MSEKNPSFAICAKFNGKDTSTEVLVIKVGKHYPSKAFCKTLQPTL